MSGSGDAELDEINQRAAQLLPLRRPLVEVG
jgi:hypothetical protein